jgi:uncharacterized protein YjdB
MKNAILRLIAATAPAFAFAFAFALACGGGDTAVTGVTIQQTNSQFQYDNVTVGAQGTVAFTAAVAPGNATNKAINWSSSDPAFTFAVGQPPSTVVVKAPSADGAVTTITAASAADPTKTATRTVTVDAPRVPCGGVALADRLVLAVGATGNLAAVVVPANATNQNVAWNSSNTAVATVTGAGLGAQIHGVAPGVAVIVVTTADGAWTACCTVTVEASPHVPCGGIVLSADRLALAVGATGNLSAVMAPANATDQNVTWNSSNTAVAAVTGGVGSALGAQVRGVAPGVAVIVVATADSGWMACCTVTVAGVELLP